MSNLNITLKDGHLHIDGYPNARRLVKLPEQPYGKRLADLRLHEHDLKFCEEAMQRHLIHRQTPENIIDNNIYLIAILAKFFSCFKKSKARMSLKKQEVFGHNNDALKEFTHLEAFRDKHIMHDENPLRTSTTCLALEENGELIDILSLSMHAYYPDDAMINNLNLLIRDAQKYVADEIQTCLAECRKWLLQKSALELKSYLDVKTEWSSNAMEQNRQY